MVSTRRSSFSVPALPTSSRKPPRVNRSNNMRSETPALPPLLPPRPPPVKPVMKSQTRTSSNTHFLRDINVDGDLLSIPDPPSPSRRCLRRLSSPLQDLTNSSFGIEHSPSSKKEQRVCQTPTPQSILDSVGDVPDHLVLSHIDLAGSTICSSYNVARRHSLSSLPSPSDIGPNPQVHNKPSILDFSGALDFSNLLLTSTLQQTKDTSHDLRTQTAPSKDVQAFDLQNGSQYRRTSIKRGRQSYQLQKLNDIAQAEPLNGGTLNSRPPRPVSTSQSRKKRQSFYIPRAKTQSDAENGNLYPNVDEAYEVLDNQDAILRKSCEASPDHGKDESFPSQKPCCGVDGGDLCRQMSTEDSPDLSVNTTISTSASSANFSKKRQSILLPNDPLHESRDEVAEFFNALAKASTKQSIMAEDSSKKVSSPKLRDSNFPLVKETKSIRHWIREYCSLPDEMRASSEAAMKIEELTGYPILRNHAGSSEGSPQNLIERRHALLVKLAPVVERMDLSKTAEKDRCERETGCRVEKSRSGRYRYYLIEDNRRITPHEYEEIYLKHLKKSSDESAKVIQKFLKDFDKAEEHNRSEQKCNVEIDLSSLGMPCGETAEQHVNMGTAQVNHESCKEGEDDYMDIRDSQSPVETETRVPNQGNSDQHISTKEDSTVPIQAVIPLPPRDDVPTDPDIAEAHQKLWDTIDDALRIYSRTVFAIGMLKSFAKPSEP